MHRHNQAVTGKGLHHYKPMYLDNDLFSPFRDIDYAVCTLFDRVRRFGPKGPKNFSLFEVFSIVFLNSRTRSLDVVSARVIKG